MTQATRQSQLSSILARHTSMQVVEIRDRMQLEINHVYVVATNSDLTIKGTTLHLAAPLRPRGHRHPVDVLFASLAEQRRERAVGIIPSGTGTNGTRGLREIKAAGGMVLVQDPAAARFDGMPRSAIGAGLADHVLPAAEMPAMRHGYVAAPDRLAAATIGSSSRPTRRRSGRCARPWRPISDGHWRTRNSSCSVNRRSRWDHAASQASRRCCAGAIATRACCCRDPSSGPPKRPA